MIERLKHWAIFAIAACSVLGCAAPNLYETNGVWVRGQRDGARQNAESMNASFASQANPGEVSPKLIKSVAPVMPREAIAQNIVGSVVVRIVVSTSGEVSAVRVIRSADPLLDQAVVAAVRQWAFSPMLVDGEASSFEVEKQFDFRIVP